MSVTFLTNEDKAELEKKIEEASQTGGGSVSDEQIAQAVEDYMETHDFATDIYMRVEAGIIQYSSDNENWKDLISIEELKGEDGKQIELQNNGSEIQWRYVGDEEWINLVALSSLKGNQGDSGFAIFTGNVIENPNGLYEVSNYVYPNGTPKVGDLVIDNKGRLWRVNTVPSAIEVYAESTGIVIEGKDGTTPQKGVDYFTDADKQDFVNDVLNALPTWQGGAY